MMPPALDVRNAIYKYPDGTCAIEDVSFSVAPNEAVALVGPSGAGKTTLMLCIVGFLQLEGETSTSRTSRWGRRISGRSGGKWG